MLVSNEKAKTKFCPYKLGLDCKSSCDGDECMAFVLNEETKLGFCGMLNNVKLNKSNCNC